MLVYRFRAASQSNFIEGEVVALSRARALARLKKIDAELELESIRLDFKGTVNTLVERWFPVPGLELAQFFRQLHLLFTAGVELSRAVRVLAESCPYARLRTALFEVDRGLQEGNGFSESLKRHPALFPAFLVGMVAVESRPVSSRRRSTARPPCSRRTTTVSNACSRRWCTRPFCWWSLSHCLRPWC